MGPLCKTAMTFKILFDISLPLGIKSLMEAQKLPASP